MTGADRQLFIYWRVAPDVIGTALIALHRLQAELREAHPGLRTGVFEREDGAPTLMETYAINGGVGKELQAAIDDRMAEALAPWTLGERHLEVFVPC